VREVLPDGPAYAVGLRGGDTIVSMNGAPVLDELDFHFQLGDDRVLFTVKRTDGTTLELDYERDVFDGDFGLTLEDPKVRLCGNDCIFCFVDQSPAGMRSSVYVRDEDYRLSFLYGNFITLTNLKEWEMRRILTQRLSPLYVSVHSLDAEIRERLFGTPRARESLPRIDRLLEGGIELHTQVVVCPGYNDGADLSRTIEGLASRASRGVRSLAIVPVGLTMHREGLPHLDPVTADVARDIFGRVTAWQGEMRASRGVGFVYLADEFYRLLQMEPPPHESYDGYPQLEDGIGLTRHFLHELELDGERILRRMQAQGVRRATLVTGELFQPTLAREMEALGRRAAGPELRAVAIRNDFFGPSVTVAGLLAGRDVLGQLAGNALGDRLCLPPSCLNAQGLLIDDVSIGELAARLGVEVVSGFGVADGGALDA
jgi:putative radical SAM enzyme (TIGR03279 family)